MPPAALQARPATGLIDLSIAITGRRYWDFFLAALIPASPVFLAAAFVPRAYIRYADFASVLAAVIGAGITACLVSGEFTGQDVPLGDAVRRAMRRSLGLLGIEIVVAFFIAFGLVALLVGALVVMALMYTAVPAFMLEGVNAGQAIDRSIYLAHDNMLRILGVRVAVLLGVVACSWVIRLVIGVAWIAVARHMYLPVRVETLTILFVSLAVRPFANVAPVVVYYDLRVRREGLDIEAMAALDAPAPADAMPNAPAANPA